MHEEFLFITDIAIIFGLSAAALFICHRLRIPAVLGFLFAGMLSGPAGFGLINSIKAVSVLAGIGVVFLLFSIGVEFSFKQLMGLKRAIFIGGTLQVTLTIGLATGVATLAGMPIEQSLVMGFLASVSSTAIVMKILQERGESDSVHAKTTLAISLFNDLASIPLMLSIPFLAGSSATMESGDSIGWMMAKGAGVILAVILSAKIVVPWILTKVVATRSKELFLITIVLVCFATAWGAAALGLSLALGAFVAGLIISESEFSEHALANMVPFKDIFISFFFVSVGMLFDVRTIVEQPALVIALSAGVLIVKTAIGAVATLAFGQPLRTAIYTGFGLSQIGEFSFILAGVAVGASMMADTEYQLFLAVAIITIGATPFLFKAAPRIADALSGKAAMSSVRSRGKIPESGLSDHLVIIGFGLNGKNLARTAKRFGIPYTILEMNNATVSTYRAKGEPIFFGDGTYAAALRQLGVPSARVLVVAVSDAAATRRIIEMARDLSPSVHIIARTRFISEVEPLLETGANDVIPEEFETSVELFARVMRRYQLAEFEIRRSVRGIRERHYSLLRNATAPEKGELEELLDAADIDSVGIPGHSAFIGKTLDYLSLRRDYAVSVIAVKREGELIANPSAEFALQRNDVVVLLGNPEQIADVIEAIQSVSS